uniref:LEM domain-containing protein n=1 Tax=Panagrolaimus davidi TaxID=227884 RepID=A0A914QK17_9BILA
MIDKEPDVVILKELSFEENVEKTQDPELPDDIKNLTISELRTLFIKAGFKPGPFSIREQEMFKRRLYGISRKK